MKGPSQRPGACRLLPMSSSCGCRYGWFQRLVSGAYSLLGCPRHSPAGANWTARTTLFHVKPDEMCDVTWDDGLWCRRGGGVHTRHVCARTADDHGKRCRCTCGAVE